MTASKSGDRVQIHYTGRFSDGTVFDSSRDREPLEFQAGGQEVIPGMSQAVLGMEPGQSKTVEIPPQEAYGPRQPDLERRVPRNLLPGEVKVGDCLRAQAGDQTINLWVAELDEESALLDANHPLAGHTLIFDIEMVAVLPAE